MMDVITFLVISLVLYGLYYYFNKKLSFFDEYGIPYVPGWPILGNMQDTLLKRKHMVEMVQEVYNVNQEAKYVGVFDMMRPVIMLRDLELIKTIAIKNFDSFPDRTTFLDDTVDPLMGGNLFNMAGDRWKEARNLLTPAFTSSKMKGMFELMVGCGENFVKYIQNLNKEKLEMVDTKDLFTKYTNDVIATCAFGLNVDSLSNPKNDFYVLGKQATNFEKFGFLLFFLSRYCPSLLRLFNIKFVEDNVGEFFKNIIKTTIATRDEKGIRRPDMIQLMMDARNKEHQYIKLDITEMTAQAFIFFFGGFETTSTQMCIIAHELCLNPDVQVKLQQEVDQVLDNNKGKVTYEAINEMPYLDAVLNESLRKHSQFVVLDRLCIKEFELPPTLDGAKSFTIKPGMNVWIPNAAIHKDQKYYQNPEKFDPERYFGKKISINDVTNLGFGIGPRSCIGNRFAILETKILIFFLMSKFSFKANAKTNKKFIYDKKVFNIRPEGGYWLTVEPRL